ncbi:MAG: bacterioferritin [Alphaproteobacteria bacterium]|nr:bacterioferritin [Alphaproteobacteria bacterium]
MKAGPEIIAALNEVLTWELTAINQYFLHAKMCENWGILKIAAHQRHESIDEMKHADTLIDRILYLDGIPNLQKLGKLRIGETIKEQFECDKALEEEAIPRLNAAIARCAEAGDNGTRAMLEQILVDEEQHLDWLETQLALIERLGEQAYIAEQLHA